MRCLQTTMGAVCLAGLALLLGTMGLANAGPPSRVKYAEQCFAEMGTIPAFNCMSGELLDITVNGVAQTKPVQVCDKPVQLGLGGDSQCVPFSRLLKVNTGKPDVTALVICRKYFESRDASDTRFDDIAVIQHSKTTGSTCFFQSKLEADLDGSSVPSPSDNSAKADKYWLSSNSVANITCTNCHGADPFIWSPYVMQRADLSTWNAFGKYDSNFADMFGEPAKIFAPKNNACASCHRFGRGPSADASCRTFPHRYSGNLEHATSPFAFLMPPDYSGSGSSWHAQFDAALAQIDKCCANPDLAECNSTLAGASARCKADSECPTGEYCDKGTLSLGKNQCLPLHTRGQSCSKEGQCGPGLTCLGEPAGECGFDATLAVDASCTRDGECVSNSCNKNRVCQCKDDAQCAGGAFCDTGTLSIGINTCVSPRGSGAACSRDGQCASGLTCQGKPLGKCIAPASVAMEGVCIKDAECASNSCSSDGRCQCKVTSDCTSGRYCDTGSIGIGKNSCVAFKPSGASCSADKQCAPKLSCKGVPGFKKCK